MQGYQDCLQLRAVPSVPGAPDPSIYLPAGISSDAAKALLENPNANPNASGTPVPFNQVCGDYIVRFFIIGTPTTVSNPDGTYTQTTPIAKTVFYSGPVGLVIVSQKYAFDWIITCPEYPWAVNQTCTYTPVGNISSLRYSYNIPCSLLPNASVPPDMFAGKGYPDGDYVIGGEWLNKSGGVVTYKGRVNQPCTKDGAYPKKPSVVASLTITPQDVSIGANKTTQFSVVGTMSDGTPADPAIINKGTVNWVSSDASIAVIYNGGTSGGQAWGKSRGTVDIWAEHNGIKSNVAKLHVGNQLQSISVYPASATIYIHNQPNSITYTASGSFTDGSTKNNISVDWVSSDNTMATIDTNGTAKTANKPGMTHIKASSAAPDYVESPPADLKIECRFVQQYLQLNPNDRWYNQQYAYHKVNYKKPEAFVGGTIASSGCTMIDYAMVLNSIKIDGSLDPSDLDTSLTNNELYEHGSNYVNMDVIFAAANSLFNAHIFSMEHVDYNYIAWCNALDSCNSIIAHVQSRNSNGHYVLIIGYMPQTNQAMNAHIFMAYDPFHSSISYIPEYKILNDSGHILITY